MSKLYITKESKKELIECIKNITTKIEYEDIEVVFTKKYKRMKSYVIKHNILLLDLVNIIFEYVDDVFIISCSLDFTDERDEDNDEEDENIDLPDRINYSLQIETSDVSIDYQKYNFDCTIDVEHDVFGHHETVVTLDNDFNDAFSSMPNSSKLLVLFDMYMLKYYKKDNYFRNYHTYDMSYFSFLQEDMAKYMKKHSWINNHKQLKHIIIIIKMIIDLILDGIMLRCKKN